MNAGVFLQDLTVVLFTAAAVLLLFRRLGQPPVLGYLAAGLLIGPRTSPVLLIRDLGSLEALAGIGVIFLLFALGVEFNLKRLVRVGVRAWLCAAMGFVFMMAAGAGMGRLLGWHGMDRIAFGGTIALASTAIVARTLLERARRRAGWEELVAGKLIAEDMIAVMLVAFFSSIAQVGNAHLSSLVSTLARFGLMVSVILFAGLLVLPRMLSAVERGGSEEVRTLGIVGICFAVSLLTEKLGFSAALGAFLAGAIASLGGPHPKLHETVEPFKDLFGGVFFVSVGMLIDPAWLVAHWRLALGLAVFTVAVRVLANFAALAAVGEGSVAAADASFASLPIGEFSFILAQVAQSHGLAGQAIYPLAVTLCLTTTLASSVLLPKAAGAPSWVKGIIPGPVERVMHRYRRNILRLEAAARASRPWKLIRPSAAQMLLNFLGVSALLLAAGHTQDRVPWGASYPGLVWTLAAFMSLPFLNAMLRKTQAVTMILIEALSVRGEDGTSPHEAKPMRTKVLVGLASGLIAAWYLALSWSSLPPWPFTLLPLAFMLAVGMLLWRGMNRFYAKLQLLLHDTLAKGDAEPEAAAQALAHFAAALTPEKVHLDAHPLGASAWSVGKTIGEIDLRARTGSSILQINRSGLPVPSPGPETLLAAGDELLLIGESAQIDKAKSFLTTGNDPSREPEGPSPDWAVSS
ncbi:MAG: cation:proton antiporter [Elusimicrobia bacterium]|nr:cation:proton antiporter [Elusimicrobiota bacterium]